MAGLFDDLIPAGDTSKPEGLFDDLVPEKPTGLAGALHTANNYLGIVPQSVTAALGPRFAASVYGIGQGLAEYPTGGPNAVSKKIAGLRKGALETYEDWKPKTDSWAQQQVAGAAESVGLMVPGLATAALTGVASTAAFLVPGVIQQGGESTGRALDEGKGPGAALLYGGTDAAFEALFEKLPMGKLVGDINAGSGFGTILWRQLKSEVPAEVLTTLAQNFNEYATLNPDKPFSEFLAEQPAAIRDTIAQTVLATGAISGAASGVSALQRRASKVDRGDVGADQRAALDPNPTVSQPGPDPVAPDQKAALSPEEEETARNIFQGTQKAPDAAATAHVASTPDPVAPPVPEPEGVPLPGEEVTSEGTPESAAAGVDPNAELKQGLAEAPAQVVPEAGETVPESEDTLEAQMRALEDRKNKRKAVFIPNETYELGSAVEPESNRVKAIALPEGVLFYDPKKGFSSNDIWRLYKSGRLGTVLGLGNFNKTEVAQSAAKGNREVAVTERTPDGLEVKAAAGTTATAANQAQTLEELKTPGNTVQVEEPTQVLAERAAAAEAPPVNPVRTIDPSTLSDEERARMQALVSAPVAQPQVPATLTDQPVAPAKTPKKPRKRASAKEVVEREEARQEKLAEIDEKVRTEQLDPAEETKARIEATEFKKGNAEKERLIEGSRVAGQLLTEYVSDEATQVRTPMERKAVLERLDTIMSEAKKRGYKFGTRGIGSFRSRADTWLYAARTLYSKMRSGKGTTKEINAFLANEWLAKKGEIEFLKNDRLEEGNRAKGRQGGSDAIERAADVSEDKEATSVAAPDTETESLEEERGATEISAEDLAPEDKAPEPVTSKGNEVDVPDTSNAVTAGEDKTGKFKVETKKKRDLSALKAKINTVRRKVHDVLRRYKNADELFARYMASGVPTGEQREIAQVMYEALQGVPLLETVEKAENRIALQEWVAERYGATSTLEEALAVEVGDLGEAVDALSTDDAAISAIGRLQSRFGPSGVPIQFNVGAPLARQLAQLVKGLKIVYLPDEVYGALFDSRSAAYYHPGYDIVVAPISVKDDPNSGSLLAHEAWHAALERAIESNPKFKDQIETLRRAMRRRVDQYGMPDGMLHDKDYPRGYWDQDDHEFMSEVLSDPATMRLAAETTLGIPELYRLKQAGFVPAKSTKLRTVLDAIKAFMNKTLELEKIAKKLFPNRNAFDAALDIAGALIEAAQKARAEEGKRPLAEMFRPKPKLPFYKYLVDGGVPGNKADALAQMIQDQFGGKANGQQLDALIAAFSVPVASTQQLGTPPGGAPPLPPQVTEAVNGGMDSNDKSKNATKARGYVLKLVTLDFIQRKYRNFFDDADGNAMDDYSNAALSHDQKRRSIEEPLNRLFAKYQDFKKANPKEAKAISDLVADMQPYDVDLRPGANHDHLGKNAKMGLQAKYRLPELQAQYNALSPNAQALFDELADTYRDVHNDAIRAVTYEILSRLPTKLSNSEVQRLMERAVEGKLTEDDQKVIGDETIWKTLQNSYELRTRKGMYFPAARFGDWVVMTELKIEKPDLKSFTIRGGKTIPITSEVNGNVVRFIAGSSEKGTGKPFDAAVSKWAAEHELPMLMYRKKYRDTKTGEIVSEGMMQNNRDYDNVIEVTLQNKGVSFFDDYGEAVKAQEQAAKDVKAGTLTYASYVEARHTLHHMQNVMTPPAVEDMLRAFDKRDDLSDFAKLQIRGMMRDIAIMQMPGNRYEKRLLKRKNVLGASDEVGRAAAHYGRAMGNYIANTMGSTARYNAFERMMEKRHDSGVASQVLNEIRDREAAIGTEPRPNQLIENAIAIGIFDKLASIANWVINGTQPLTNTLPVLAGRFGAARTSAAMLAAYRKLGVAGTVGRGLKNTGTAVTQWGKLELDTEDVVGSIKKRLGPKYQLLMDTLIERGDIADDVGIEAASGLSQNLGAFSRAVMKTARISRQMANAVEAINRTASALAAYDLAMSRGMTALKAANFASDVVRQTQGRYDSANTPQIMKIRGLRFFLVFQKYVQLQYQLLGDMAHRAFKDADAEERTVALKQLGYLVAVNSLILGTLGAPGVELFKLAAMVMQLFGNDDGWEDWQEWFRKLLEEAVGKDLEQVITQGLLAKAVGVELQARMGWQDLLTGFTPDQMSSKTIMGYVGQRFAGAPGSTYLEMLKATEELQKGNYLKGLSLLIPLKQGADIAKAVGGYRQGKLSGADAVKQSVGFRSMRQAEKDRETGVAIRANKKQNDEEAALKNAYINAFTGDARIKALLAIRKYNARLKPGERKISVGSATSGLEKYRRERMRQYAD